MNLFTTRLGYSLNILHSGTLLVLFWCICGSAGLKCNICEHTGLSMVPPRAPNSRFVFNANTSNCQEIQLQCGPREDFCLSAYAKAGPNKYWVQKGCVESGGGGRGSGCNQELLDLSQVRNLPVRVPPNPLRLTVCVCNTHDSCNSGLVDKMSNASNNITHNLVSYFIVLTLIFIRDIWRRLL